MSSGLEVVSVPIASADRALATVLDGPPRALTVVLQTSAAAYLGTTVPDDAAHPGAQPHQRSTPDDDAGHLGAQAYLVLVDAGGITVPDSILLSAGLTWRQFLAPHLASRAVPIRIGDGFLRCGHHTIAVRPSLGLTVPAVPAHLAAAGLAQIDAALRSADRPRAATPWPALDHRWSSGVADPPTLLADAPALIGRGPGVTPSGDDILAAAILGHTVLGTPGIGAVAAQIAGLSAGRTTAAALVSTRGAADGRAAEPLRRALSTLAQGRDATGPLRQVLSLGHTSGADLMRGLRDAFSAATQTTHSTATHTPVTPAAATHPAPHGVAERKVS